MQHPPVALQDAGVDQRHGYNVVIAAFTQGYLANVPHGLTWLNQDLTPFPAMLITALHRLQQVEVVAIYRQGDILRLYFRPRSDVKPETYLQLATGIFASKGFVILY